MSFSSRVLTHILILAIVFASPAFLQAENHIEPDAGQVVVRGQDLPRYFGVEAFFRVLFELYRADEEGEYEPFLRHTFGVSAPSELGVFTRATLLASSLERETLDTGHLYDKPVQLDRARRELRARKAGDLGEIYWGMMAELQSLGIDVAKIETYVDEEIRPGQSLSSSRENPQGKYAEAAARFLAARDGVQ